jgi:FKBP-type peptidyl-prolyl cis-trans isomerase 2
MKVQPGSLVSLEYDILLDTGEEIDSSSVNGPLHIRIGGWEALPGLGERLLGLEVGDERLVRLTPKEAFGDWDPDAVLTIRDSHLVGEECLADGTTLRIETQGGSSAICRVYRITADRVALDFNHPLAGTPLTLFVRVKDVVPPGPLPSEFDRGSSGS